MKNINPWILLGIILILAVVFIPKTDTTQTVAPSCFTKEDCKYPIMKGYCDVTYDCLQGKCYNQQVKCPENCSNNIDDDMDGKFDCEDSDCYTTQKCPCRQAPFNQCKKQQCYCAFGEARWVVYAERSGCECI